MKEEIKKIIEQFIEETKGKRTVYNGNLSSISLPTFTDFIQWLQNK